jgi:DNA-binding MarR family transcriptional regulator
MATGIFRVRTAERQHQLACYCAGVRHAARAVTKVYDEVFRPLGLKATQFTILEALKRNGEARILDLCDVLVIDQTTLTRNLALMARAGWIEVQAGDEDRRERYWKLTRAGKALHARARPLWRSAQVRLETLRGVSAMSSLKGDLAKLVEDLEA